MERRSRNTINQPWNFFGLSPIRLFVLSMFLSLYLCFFLWEFGIWGVLLFVPIGYLIALAIDIFLEYLVFPSLNVIFKKSYGPTTIVRDIMNFNEDNKSLNEIFLEEEKKKTIKRLCFGNWDDALAGGAFEKLLQDQPEFLDDDEQRRNSFLMKSLIRDLKEFDSSRNWEKIVKEFASRVASSYLDERQSGQIISSGGGMTLIGHASSSFIREGFIGTVASILDNGATERAYNNYIAVDAVYKKMIRGGSTKNYDYEKLAELWKLALSNLTISFEKLEKAIRSFN